MQYLVFSSWPLINGFCFRVGVYLTGSYVSSSAFVGKQLWMGAPWGRWVHSFLNLIFLAGMLTFGWVVVGWWERVKIKAARISPVNSILWIIYFSILVNIYWFTSGSGTFIIVLPFCISIFAVFCALFRINSSGLLGGFIHGLIYGILTVALVDSFFILNNIWAIHSDHWVFDFGSGFILDVRFHWSYVTVSFVILTYIVYIAALIGWEIDLLVGSKRVLYKGDYWGLGFISLISGSLVCFFLIPNILCMFIFFEFTVIPTVGLLWIAGSKTRKRSLTYLVLYTSISSLSFLIFSLCILQLGNLSLFYNIQLELLPPHVQYGLVVFLVLMVFVKAPIYPLHIWLPEAHVESPTAGSTLLAGILLKAGVFLAYKFYIVAGFSNFVQLEWLFLVVISLYSALYALLASLAQSDVKRCIAFLSISHMSLALIGIWGGTLSGVLGCFYMLFSHGLVSTGLFLLIGFFYVKSGVGFLGELGNIFYKLPLFSWLFILLLLNNLSIPGTLTFKAEFLLFLSVSEFSGEIVFLFLLSVFFNSVVTLYLISGLVFGERVLTYKHFLVEDGSGANALRVKPLVDLFSPATRLYLWIGGSLLLLFYLGIGGGFTTYLYWV